MPAYDAFHGAVKRGLIKDGWTITHDPYPLEYGGADLYVDLGAERVLAAERGDRWIAVEIKSFIGPSLISDYHTALGQFLNYRLALQKRDPNRVLFLAVPRDTYEEFFTLPFAMESISVHRVDLIVFDPELEELVKWIRQPTMVL